MSLARVAARGGAVTLLGQAMKIAIQFAALIILSRLLGPEDFGLVVMVTAVIGVGELIRDFGLSAAAMQAASISQAEKSNLFWANTLIGAGLTVVVAACAYPLAALYDEPRLVPITLALSVTFLINGLQTQFQVELARSLRFKALMATEVCAQVAGLAAAIVVVQAGYGYWALVAQLLAIPLVLCVGRVGLARWRPGGVFHATSIRSFIAYGSHLVAAQVVNYLSSNAPAVLIGIRLTPFDVGQYNRASQIAITPISQILSPLTNVVLPILSRVRGDRLRFSAAILGVQRAMGYGTVLVFAVVAVAADSIVEVALGDGWDAAGDILAILAVGAVFQTLSFVGYWVFLAHGATKSLFRYNVVTKGLTLLLSVTGLFWGPTGVALGFAVGLALAWPICIYWLHRKGLVDGSSMGRSGAQIVAVAIIASGAGLLLSPFLPLDPVPHLLGSAAVVCIAGVLAMLITPRTRSDLSELVKVVTGVFRRA